MKLLISSTFLYATLNYNREKKFFFPGNSEDMKYPISRKNQQPKAIKTKKTLTTKR